MAMASSSLQPLPPIAIPFPYLALILSLIVSISPIALSQNPISKPIPTTAQCASRLLPLAPCAPFVQGMALSPAQPCCDNLKQLYSQEPACLCRLLNDTTLSSLPINTSLALQLPSLCSLQLDISTCSGILVPPTTPGSQVSPGTNSNSNLTNSTIAAASPGFQLAPRPSIMALGTGRSSATIKLIAGYEFSAILSTLALLVLTNALY